ncbi:MAG TPA: hypothetical protein VKP78_11120 [bacterium]|nr:hypothetical protein [bacterium]
MSNGTYVDMWLTPIEFFLCHLLSPSLNIRSIFDKSLKAVRIALIVEHERTA